MHFLTVVSVEVCLVEGLWLVLSLIAVAAEDFG
jgi:hypothetical protein